MIQRLTIAKTISKLFQSCKMAKKDAECTTIDPKAAALAFLKINLGSKNIRTLSKDEVYAAFLKQSRLLETR